MIHVSRLRWRDMYETAEGRPIPEPGADVVDVPHVRGVPVDGLVPSDAVRIREWPNRLGIYESGSAGDHVHWSPTIGIPPPDGSFLVRTFGPPFAGSEPPDDLGDRVRWFRRFLKSLAQHAGVMPAVDPPAPCTILLTPGIDAGTLASGTDAFPGAIGSIPDHLGEFPGGVQLALTDGAWKRRDAYAGIVVDIVRESG